MALHLVEMMVTSRESWMESQKAARKEVMLGM